MTEPSLRPRDTGSGALLLGGIFVVLFPQHSVSILRVLVVTLAAATGVYALLVTAPTAWWTSPFEKKRRTAVAAPASEELNSIRSMLSGRRQVLESGAALPPQALRLLKPMIESALAREGVDLGTDAGQRCAEDTLSPTTWAILTGEPLLWPRWYQTRQPNEGRASEVVNAVLDDIEKVNDKTPRIAVTR